MSRLFLAVMPAIDEAHCREAVAAASPQAGELLIIDNTADGALAADPPTGVEVARPVAGNYGVAASWNLAARRVIDGEADWLIILSHALLLHEPLHVAGERLIAVGEAEGVAHSTFGWHLVAISRGALRVVGLFDENYYPAWFEETDWLYRAGLASVASPRENGRAWPYTAIHASDRGHGIQAAQGRVRPDWRRLEGYYAAKWGGTQGHETYRRPFDLEAKDWAWCAEPHGALGSTLTPWLSTSEASAR